MDLREGGNVSQLLVSPAHAVSLPGALALAPAELFGGRFENGSQPFIFQVLQPELQRIHLHRMRQFVHVRLARKVVGSRGQRSIRSLPQWRFHCMKHDPLVSNFIVRTNPRRPGVIVVKLPGRDRPILLHSAAHIDDSGRTEICPRKLLFPRPDHLDGTLRRPRQPRRLNRGLPGMLPAISRSHVRHQHADVFFRNMKRFGQLTSHPKRPLRSSPHR